MFATKSGHSRLPLLSNIMQHLSFLALAIYVIICDESVLPFVQAGIMFLSDRMAEFH